MIVDVDAIGQDGEADVTLPFAEMVESGVEISFADPVVGEITLTRSGAITWARGRVTTTVPLTCGRCLRSFAYRLVGTFAEGFRRGAESAPRPQGSGALILPLDGAALDLTEVVRQHLVMALPLVPLCRAECRGLCPVCGADRNEVVCGCVARESDPRLAVLRQFRPASG